MWFRDIFRRTERARAASRPGGDSGLDDLGFLRRLDRLTLRTSRFLRGEAAGQRASLRRIPSNDFREHRLYLPGDDLRHVDWNASARAEHVFVKLGEQPKEATVHVLLDNSASMEWGEPAKLWAARRLAAGLGYLALGGGDRLTMMALAGGPADYALFGPSHGKARIPAMVRYLRGVRPLDRADLNAAVRHFAARHAGGGLAVIISDLLGGFDLAAALEHFPLPRWQVLVLHLLHPAELAPALQGEIELEDVETRAQSNYDITPAALAQYAEHVRAWCAAVERVCFEDTVAYARVLSDWPIEQAVLPYLQRRGVIEAA